MKAPGGRFWKVPCERGEMLVFVADCDTSRQYVASHFVVGGTPLDRAFQYAMMDGSKGNVIGRPIPIS